MNQTAAIILKILTASLVFLLTGMVHAQSMKLTVAAFDGKSGKPLSAQRLLVFMGNTQEEVSLHIRSLSLTTGKDGLAVLDIDDSQNQWIQVLVDFHTLCQTTPRAPSLSVREIVATGLSTPNTCGSFKQETSPTRLNVYARSPTLREKMAW
jgi:hypothetical protein